MHTKLTEKQSQGHIYSVVGGGMLMICVGCYFMAKNSSLRVRYSSKWALPNLRPKDIFSFFWRVKGVLTQESQTQWWNFLLELRPKLPIESERPRKIYLLVRKVDVLQHL